MRDLREICRKREIEGRRRFGSDAVLEVMDARQREAEVVVLEGSARYARRETPFGVSGVGEEYIDAEIGLRAKMWISRC